jgi:hypothetical protein
MGLLYLYLYIKYNNTDIAVLLTHNLPRTETQKITKYENLVQAIENIWKLNNKSIYSSVISAEEAFTKSFLKYLENTDFTKKYLRCRKKQYCYKLEGIM